MTETKCSACNARIPAAGKFCPDCGAPTGAAKAQKSKGKAASGKSNAVRDNLIIVGVIVVIAGGYFMTTTREEPPQPVQQVAAVDPENPHGSVDGMMGALPNMPADFEGLVTMGNQTMDQQNFPIAAECYKRALAIKPNDVNVRTDFGACLHGMGIPGRAIEEFHKVLVENPNHGVATYNLGIVFFGIGQNDSAKYYWESYLKKEPNGDAAASTRQYLEQL